MVAVAVAAGVVAAVAVAAVAVSAGAVAAVAVVIWLKLMLHLLYITTSKSQEK